MAIKRRPKKALSIKKSGQLGGYFASLTVRNIRCFGPEQTLNLLDQHGSPARWTVLLGDNGVGKTTLLRAIAIVTPVTTPDALKERSVEGLRAPVAELVNTIRTRSTVHTHIAFGLMSREIVRKGADASPGFAISAKLHYKPELQFVKRAEVISEIVSDGRLVAPMTPNRPIFCVGYGASRRMGAGSLDTPKENPFATLFDDHAPLRNAEEWLILADYAANKEAGPQKKARAEAELARVKAALIELLPDVQDIRVEIDTKPGAVPNVEVKTHDGWVGLRDLSLGYRTTMAWMIDLAARMFEAHPQSENPLAEPAVALIDEIDLHLHPTWQRTLIVRLEQLFPNTQFIVTAHSPLVIQAAPDANIAVLRREGDHVIIDQDQQSVRGWWVDQILTSDLFGLPSARDPAQDELRKRREALLGKARLTKADEAELERIEAKLVEPPGGETPQEIEAMSIIMRAAAKLKRAGAGGQR